MTNNIEKTILKARKVLKEDPKLLKMFENCFTNTYNTTTQLLNDHDTFIITGDIPAMWLRDSSAQVFHYLNILEGDIPLQHMITGLIHRQIQCILLDPYANAFNLESVYKRDYYDQTDMHPLVWERKYEIDSLCYPIWLSYHYYKKTKHTDIFDKDYLKALYTIIDLWTLEQDHSHSTYRFERPIASTWNLLETETLQRQGNGLPVNYTGMTWCGFRPSDDACRFNYLIPSNMFASVVLGYIEEIADIYEDEILKDKAHTLKFEIDYGIKCYGIYHHPLFGDIYAYETDGFGNYHLMDDANVPSLLSIPYLGYVDKNDPIYQNTRAFILSKNNPFYYEGKIAKGIGSPHTPKDYIWHIALSMQALTSNDENEIKALIELIKDTDDHTHFTHEGFHKDDPSQYTRPWFAWSNSLFAYLIYQTYLL